MIETFFTIVWVCLATLLILSVNKALRQRARESRHDQMRAFRRFTGHSSSRSGSRHRQHSGVYQPAS